MKEIKLVDPHGTKTIRMCNKHYRQYKGYLSAAQRGGTSFYSSDTNKRGCMLCNTKGKL